MPFVRSILVVGVLAGAVAWASPTRAQSDAEVAAARKTFGEAVKDEEARQFALALEKFRQVQSVKDTPAVRFRIAACLEGLGRLGEARASYAAAAELAGTDPQHKEVVSASKQKVGDLDRRLPTLTLTLPPNAPPDAVVTVDEQPAALGKAIVVDPGEHRIHAHAAGVPSYESRVTLQEGARTSLMVPFEAKPKADVVVPPPSPPSNTRTTVGWALVGTGAGLVIVSGVALLVREGAISSIEEQCPQNRCPASKRDDVISSRDRAELMLPTALVAGGVGAAAAGVGIALLVTAPRQTSNGREVRLRVAPSSGAAKLVLEGTL